MRPLLTFTSDDLIKAIVECVINKLNCNHKLSKEEKGKMTNYKNLLRPLVNPNVCYKNRCKVLIQRGGFIIPLLTSNLFGVIGAIQNNNFT